MWRHDNLQLNFMTLILYFTIILNLDELKTNFMQLKFLRNYGE